MFESKRVTRTRVKINRARLHINFLRKYNVFYMYFLSQ